MSTAKRSSAVSRLADVKLEKEAYEADLQVNDRAQVFVTEIVRLGLLAIGGTGFLIKAHEGRLGPDWLLLSSLVLFGIAIGTALFHRYFSTDCIVCQIAILRLIMRLERTDLDEDTQQTLKKQLGSRRDRQERDMYYCRRLTLCAAIALAGGALCLAILIGLR
ncbi:MAG TPA: hypothetical protein VGS07_23270 [Thermoanaerobaculia bacterium]|jgi:hypothetical protein|nr:hypothetical protein [Thermoanaerobaculia bacterium]